METTTIQKNKWNMLSRRLFMMIFVLFFMSGFIQAQEVVNTNWDFSESTIGDSTATDWWILGTDFADYEFIEDPDDASNILLQATITDIDSVDNPWDIQVASVNTVLDSGATYVISGRIKYESSTGAATGTINFTSGDVGIHQYGASINSGEWTVFALDTVHTDTLIAANVGFHIGYDTHANDDVFYIDYIKIEKQQEEGDPEPEPEYPFSESVVWNFDNPADINSWTNGTNTSQMFAGNADATEGDSSMQWTYTVDPSLDWGGSADIELAVADTTLTNLSEFGAMSLDYKVLVPVSPTDGGASLNVKVYAATPDTVVQYHYTVPGILSDVTGEWQTAELLLENFAIPSWIASTYPAGYDTDLYADQIQKIEMQVIVGNAGSESSGEILLDNLAPFEAPLPIPEPPYAVGDTINYNGSLEFSDLGETAPEAWTISLAAGSTAEVVDDAADGDSRALKLSVTYNGTADQWYANEAINNPINVVQGETYEASAWLKADEDGRIGRLYASMPESGGYQRARGWDTPQTTLTTEWQRVAFTFVASATQETNGMRLGVELNNSVNDGGIIYIDDLVIKKTEDAPTGPTMDPIAEGKSKWLGNIYSSPQIQDFTSYWNQVTPENAGKWGSVEGTRDQMNWGGMDAAYALAKDNGFPIRFHILIWGGQQPGWINDLSTTEQEAEIKEWMDAVAERYPELDYVEVVNEGSNGHQLPDGDSGDANYIEALGGTGETGHDWIITAFEWARERFPNAKLMINDYGIVGNVTATQNYINIIEDLQAENLIDVIGVQSHAFSTTGSAINLRRTLNLLAETGLPIQATEMDIQGETDQEQLDNMKRIFPTFWEHPAVEGVTMWGWRPGLWMENAELILENGEERPALEWLRAYVDTADVAVSNEELTNNLPGKYELYHNYPNPFNPTTQIQYALPQATEVSIKVYDVTGRLIQTLVSSQQPAGSHTVSFNASNLSSGVYFYRIEAGSFTNVKRMMLIK